MIKRIIPVSQWRNPVTTPQDPNSSQGWGQQQPGPGGQPPQGQHPQGQQPQGQPWGAPQQPGQFGAPQGQPGQPGQQWDGQQQGQQPAQPWAGAGASGQVEEPKKSGWKKRLPAVIGAVVAVTVFALVRNGLFASDPEAGDCTNGSLTSLEVVDCDDSEATYRIAGVLEDVSGDELRADDSLCLTEWPNSVAYAVDADSQSEEGTGYCLESIS